MCKEENVTLTRIDPIEVTKAVVVLTGAALLVAFLFHDIGGMPFRPILLIGCFVVPPALAAMLFVLLAGRWIGMRIGVAAGWTLALTLPFGIAAAAVGFLCGFLVLTRFWNSIF